MTGAQPVNTFLVYVSREHMAVRPFVFGRTQQFAVARSKVRNAGLFRPSQERDKLPSNISRSKELVGHLGSPEERRHVVEQEARGAFSALGLADRVIVDKLDGARVRNGVEHATKGVRLRPNWCDF